MKRLFCLVLCALIALSGASCKVVAKPEETAGTGVLSPTVTAYITAEPTETPDTTPGTAQALDYAQETVQFIDMLLEEDYTGCEERLDPMVLSQLGAGGLEQMWEAVIAECGPFIRYETGRTYTRPYFLYSYTTVFCEFENSGIAVTALYGGDTVIQSLLINEYLPHSRLVYETSSEATPLIWKAASDDGSREMYLMGSFHLADESLYGMPEAIMDAYTASDALALEYDLVEAALDLALYLEGQTALVYTDGSTIKDHLRPETYEKAVAFLTGQNAYNEAYDSITATGWNSLVSVTIAGLAGLDSNYGVDMYFASLAHADGKKILEVESQKFQQDLLGSVSEELWDFYISTSIDYYLDMQDQIKAMYQAYFTGNEAALIELIREDEEIDTEDPAFVAYTQEEIARLIEENDRYNSLLMAERNAGMLNTAIGYLESGATVFFLVGAAHILGEIGLVSLLTQAGYTVEQLVY
ncbi:MAG: hypothetical protein GX111_00220 [Clostridiales bacterium]|nr:hypothetical protein [Clostridiales bacterium]